MLRMLVTGFVFSSLAATALSHPVAYAAPNLGTLAIADDVSVAAAQDLRRERALAVRELGEATLPNTFGDVIILDDGTVEAYARGDVSRLAARVADRWSIDEVRVRQVPRGRRDLEAVRLGLSSWRPAGVTVTETYPDFRTGQLVVGVSPLTSSVSAEVAERFGGSVVVRETPRIMAVSRQADNSPWTSGDFIAGTFNDYAGDPFTQYCSSAFAVHDLFAIPYIITAAHCFPVGDGIINKALPSAGLTSSSAFMGRVDKRDGRGYPDPTTDAALIQAPGNARTWIAGTNASAPVAGTGADVVGDFVCTSGAYETEVCNVKVVATGVNTGCAPGQSPTLVSNIDGGYYCPSNQTRAVNTVTYPVGSGDSGGPVYRRSSTTAVTALGMMSGAGAPVGCQRFPTGRSCSATVYWTPIRDILSFFNVAIN